MTSHGPLAPVGTLCLGPSLGWPEQMSLKSLLAQGHAVTLFSYGPVAGVPGGVSHQSAVGVLEPGPILDPTVADPGLYADLFRLYMLHHHDGMIWADLRTLCLAPLVAPGGYLFAPEDDGKARYGPVASAWAAICVSSSPIGVPCFLSCALNLP